MAGFVAGARVQLQNIVTQPELNGQYGELVSEASQEGRWKVRVDGREKKLALKPENLRVIEEGEVAAAPEIVGVKCKGGADRVAVVLRQQGPQLEVEYEDGEKAWVGAADAAPLVAAEDDTVPTEFLYCRVRAKLPRSSAYREGSVEDIRLDPAGRPRLLVSFEQLPSAWLRLDQLRAAEGEPVPTASTPAEKPPAKPASQAGGSKKGSSKADGVSGSGGGGGGGGGGAGKAAASAGKGKAGKARPMEAETTAPGEKRRRKQPAPPPAAAEVAGGAEGAEGAPPAPRPRAQGGTGARPKPGAAGSSADDAWEAALDAMQPRDEGEEGDAPAAPAAPARDPRLQGFRIGGQAETAEERGEWCGPWSTAMQLIARREAALEEHEAAEGGEAPPPLVTWTPRRSGGAAASGAPMHGAAAAARREHLGGVPSLQALCVDFLVANIGAVSSFGVLPPGALHAIASGLSAQRALSEEALPLFTQEGAGGSELLLPDCHLLSEEALSGALGRLSRGCPAQLTVVHLGFCGRGLTPEVCALLHPCERLHTVRLTGCYRLTTAALTALCEARGAGLRSLTVTGNSQLGPPAIVAIGARCAVLENLAIEDCDQLPSEALTPLARLTRLQALSLSGLCMLNDDALGEVLSGSAAVLESLRLRGCSLLTDAALQCLALTCPRLRELDLTGVELLTDSGVLELAKATLGLHVLSLKQCVQLSDEAVVALAAACRGTLRVLSLNKVPALSDLSLQALAQQCASTLETLDISWCRGVSDDGAGLLADACSQLHTLSIWGCSQLTQRFLHGHSNEQLRIVGRGPTQ